MPGIDIIMLAARRSFSKYKREVGRCVNNTMTDQRGAMNKNKLSVWNKNKQYEMGCRINNIEGVDSWKIHS